MDNTNSTPSFEASVALVSEEINNIKELHRSAHTKRLQFVIDVCLVAHGVRTGYLVDAVCPPNPMDTLGTLLMILRKKSSVFKDVMFWHHTPTMQSFLVHAPLLQGKISALLGGAGECVFIKLDKCLSVSKDPPDGLREALYGMRSVMEESPDALVHPLSEVFAEDILIPLAAVVIDYPVAYFPASSVQTSFLEGVALDIYTVSFKWLTRISGFEREHVLLKFSCPQVLASNHAELSPNTVIRKLQVKFATSLGRIGICVFVTHHAETLERVAL